MGLLYWAPPILAKLPNGGVDDRPKDGRCSVEGLVRNRFDPPSDFRSRFDSLRLSL